jgi:asparagine synthase (glutamine-hydrolysing)
MVGIVGYTGNRVEQSMLPAMMKTMQWTNKEQTNTYHDDHLSIARISHGITNVESQPIFNDDHSIMIILEGNVYDYGKSKDHLINKGYRFNFEHNDAEYCLHLYEEMGNSAFRELNGCFVIAIYSILTHDLLLVNDRFSSRQLFYYFSDKRDLLFGTQMSSILVSSQVPRELDLNAVFEFFTFQRVLGTKTYYKNISVLRPAHILSYHKGNLSLSPFWQMKHARCLKKSRHYKEYYSTKLAQVLKQSVIRKTLENHHYGLLLSGGLDSRMVLACSDRKMTAFTFGDFENLEIKIAKEIAEAVDCKSIFLKRSSNHYSDLLDTAVKIGDGMYSFIHAHSVGFFEEILKYSDVMFHGNPPELFFRGSSLPHSSLNVLGVSIPLPLRAKLTSSNIVHMILRKLKYSIYQLNPEQLFKEPYSTRLNEALTNSLKGILQEADNNVTNIYDKFCWLDIYYTSRYPSFLIETSIRQFMEERTLLFDNDVYDLYLEMPLEVRSNKEVWVTAMAKLNPDIAGIPNSNTGYSPFAPSFLDWAIKLSRDIAKEIHFSAPPQPTYETKIAWSNMGELLRYDNKLVEIAWRTIHDQDCLDPSIFNIQRIEKMFKAHLAGKEDHKTFLFLLLTFGRWYKMFGPRSKYVK